MLTAVILGAFGAHGLKELISKESLEVFKTGVFYQFIHALSILLVVILAKTFDIEKLKYSVYFFITGILLFSGSLYFLSTKSATGFNVSFLGPVTPLGGLMFIIGWFFIVVTILKSKNLK